jgi:phosphoribosylaminoimidazole-succinocarboxamide synthase
LNKNKLRGIIPVDNYVLETNFPELNLLKRGKVRDIYDLGDSLLMIATDRISAFDVIMNNPVPGKGKILTQISLFWFDAMKDLIQNHIISSDVDGYPDVCKIYADDLQGRSMLVKKAEPLSIECVVRGYISGSGWASYQESGRVCGIELPQGLKESDKLPEPIFTPSTKAELGEHDINIDFEEAADRIGRELAENVKKMSIAIYKKGAEIAAAKDIIIADTKFEFGILDKDVILIDEILTPDSSRFWPKKSYAPGGPQKSYDKQYLRDYLSSIAWDKKPPAPPLPDDVIQNTSRKYKEALTQLTGKDDID